MAANNNASDQSHQVSVIILFNKQKSEPRIKSLNLNPTNTVPKQGICTPGGPSAVAGGYLERLGVAPFKQRKNRNYNLI